MINRARLVWCIEVFVIMFIVGIIIRSIQNGLYHFGFSNDPLFTWISGFIGGAVSAIWGVRK